MSTEDTTHELITIRDWLRYCVSRFTAAGLDYGHGTDNAVDEAVFLVLEALRLPIDSLEPWLDARLVAGERRKLADLVEARVARRIPAAYLVGAAYIRRHRFLSDPRAIVPRSFIGELLADAIDGERPGFPPGLEIDQPRSILDLCTGGGSLAVLAALAFPDATICAVDISPDALALARENVVLHGLADRVHLVQADLCSGLARQRFDLVISNPPYVTDEARAAFPPEHRAEPALAHAGGRDGLTLVRRIVTSVGRHLNPGGMLVMEIGAARPAFEAVFPQLDPLWLETETSSGEVLVLPAAALASQPRTRRSGVAAGQDERGR